MTKNRYSGPLDSTAILRFPPGGAGFLNTITVFGTPPFPFRDRDLAKVTETLAPGVAACLLWAHADCANHFVSIADSDSAVDNDVKRGHESTHHRVREVDVSAVVSGWSG